MPSVLSKFYVSPYQKYIIDNFGGQDCKWGLSQKPSKQFLQDYFSKYTNEIKNGAHKDYYLKKWIEKKVCEGYSKSYIKNNFVKMQEEEFN